MTTPAILNLEGLTILRAGNRILDQVSWTIAPGQHWVILGANGSGKTSMLASMTGYLPPTAGVLEILGERYGASNWIELRRRIGIVSSAVRQQMADEEPAVVSVVSGRYAMIDYWGDITEEDEREALAILDRLDCRHLADRPWLFLSQGERQRVLIGRALMAQPELLILDEPCSGLDPVAREQFLHFIQRLTQQPSAPALILVTHHVEEIVDGFSHVLVLKQGRLLASGPKEETLTSPILSKAFATPVTIGQREGRYTLELEGPLDRLSK